MPDPPWRQEGGQMIGEDCVQEMEANGIVLRSWGRPDFISPFAERRSRPMLRCHGLEGPG
jgi:hypothetical protein